MRQTVVWRSLRRSERLKHLRRRTLRLSRRTRRRLLPRTVEFGPRAPVYLTFDDGPDPFYSPAILDILARFDAKAVFFVIGSQLDAAPHVVERLLAEGHSLGNHTWSHRRLAGVRREEFDHEVTVTQQRLWELFGQRPRYLRPPFGSMDRNTRKWANELKLDVSLWDVDPMDWDRPGTSHIERSVLEETRPGSVILLHDGGGDREQTVAALPNILTELSRKGVEFPLLPGSMVGERDL